MGKASSKEFLTVITTLVANLPKREVENFDSDTARAIIKDPKTSGRNFMKFMQREARIDIVGLHVIDCSADPKIIEGWKVKRHRRTGDFLWNPNKVSLYPGDKKNGEVIKVLKELKGKALNANVLDYLLEHVSLIPEEWKKGRYVLFCGTIYRGSDGNLYVRYLNGDGDRWRWGTIRLDHDWNGHYFVAVFADAA